MTYEYNVAVHAEDPDPRHFGKQDPDRDTHQRIRIRIGIKVKSRIQIRLKVMRICNTGTLYIE